MRRRKGGKKLTGTINDYPLVRITCFDWLSSAEWMSIPKGEKIEPCKCFAVGWLFVKTKFKISLFSTWSEDPDGIEIGSIETIPRTWVEKINKIKTK